MAKLLKSVGGVTPDMAAAVIARARGKCEQCDRGSGMGIPMQISHTIARGMGGTHGERSIFIHGMQNLRYLCELCHMQLFHHQTVRYYPGTAHELSCTTCAIRTRCREQAMLRGILSEDYDA
jgi:hypothetical protein